MPLLTARPEHCCDFAAVTVHASAPVPVPPSAGRGRRNWAVEALHSSASSWGNNSNGSSSSSSSSGSLASPSPRMMSPLQATLIAPAPVSIASPEQQEQQACHFADLYASGEVLGQGAYGQVCVAVHRASGAEVAVKFVPRTLGRAARAAQLRETQIWKRLSSGVASGTVARLLGTFEEPNGTYFVQELCMGGSLLQMLDAAPGPGLTPGEVAQVAAACAAFLAGCHSLDIVYGDVKPANFLLRDLYPSIAHMLNPSRPKGAMRLRATDFGCSQVLPLQLSRRTAGGCGAPCVAALCGTPLFAAPEMLAPPGNYGLAVDMWALGVMLYQLACRRMPFWEASVEHLQAMDLDDVYAAILEQPVLFTGPEWDTAPEEMKSLIRGLLERDPAKRLTAEEALRHPFVQCVTPQ